MAQPKRRWSKARTGAKRSTWKIEETNLSALFLRDTGSDTVHL